MPSLRLCLRLRVRARVRREARREVSLGSHLVWDATDERAVESRARSETAQIGLRGNKYQKNILQISACSTVLLLLLLRRRRRRLRPWSSA